MSKYILGYPDEGSELVEYQTKEEAAFESEEWLEVEANSLYEAKAKYETEREAFDKVRVISN